MRVARQIQLAGTKADALIAGVARRYGLSHAALNALAVIEGAGGPLPAGVTATMSSLDDRALQARLDALAVAHDALDAAPHDLPPAAARRTPVRLRRDG